MPRTGIFSYRTTEFEAQATCYIKLKNVGYLVRGEVKCPKNEKKKLHAIRFDLVIFDPETKEPLIFIEVKKDPDDDIFFHLNEYKHHEQIKHYSALMGVPGILVYGLKDAEQIIQKVENVFPFIVKHKIPAKKTGPNVLDIMLYGTKIPQASV